MQRFKDFTKKSGKVASAILSAAMVTSMVAGTNVIQAAEVNTQAVDVQAASTQENDKEAVLTATAYYVEAVKDLPVNAATAETEDGFTVPEEALETKFGVTITVALENTDAKGKVPDAAKGGEKVATITVTKGAYTKTTEVTYKLASLTERTEEAKKLIEARLDKYAANNALTDALAQKEVDNALDVTESGIDLYADIEATVGTTVVTDSTATEEGAVQIPVKIVAEDGQAAAANKTINFDYSKKTENATVRANAATDAVKAYLADCNLLDSTFADGTLKTAIDNYLKFNGFPDVLTEKAVAPATAVNVKATVDEATTNFSDGKGTATYQLSTMAKDGNTAIVSADKVEQDVTLLCAQTKVNKATAELKAIADDVTVEKADDKAAYAVDFTEKLQAAYLPTYQAADPTTLEMTAAGAVTDFTTVYPGVTATATFSDKDANASADGAKTVVITVASTEDDQIVATTEKTYVLNSAQSEADQAKAAAEAAIADMTITNDTTDAEVKAVIDDAIAGYDVTLTSFSFDKTDATADKEGKATISFIVVSTADNNISAESKVEKTFAFKSNTFVVEDGKKVYYNKEGKKLQNTFLQGTESPDGYTYYIQNDGSVMQDRLTYHPNGKDVIYFDAEGHEVFDAFVNVKKDIQGNAVDYIGYFDTFGNAYVNQTTYGNGEGAYATDALFYINDYGVLENKGWFKNAAGEIGYAATNGTLTTSQWSLDQFGRKVYFQANGFLAKGLMTDGVKYYQLDETDGHLVGEF